MMSDAEKSKYVDECAVAYAALGQNNARGMVDEVVNDIRRMKQRDPSPQEIEFFLRLKNRVNQTPGITQPEIDALVGRLR